MSTIASIPHLLFYFDSDVFPIQFTDIPSGEEYRCCGSLETSLTSEIKSPKHVADFSVYKILIGSKGLLIQRPNKNNYKFHKKMNVNFTIFFAGGLQTLTGRPSTSFKHLRMR
jgi:hypothetical protein